MKVSIMAFFTSISGNLIKKVPVANVLLNRYLYCKIYVTGKKVNNFQ